MRIRPAREAREREERAWESREEEERLGREC